MASPVLLSLSAIEKNFGGVVALAGVSFEAASGEIHALVGENGAGKSTLVKILIGLYPYGSYRGEFFYQGKPCRVARIADSQSLGINMVFQELSLVPGLSIAENLFLGCEIKNRFGMIQKQATLTKAQEILSQLNLDLDPKTLVGELGVGQQQMVEIGKAIHRQTKVLILDEPTAGLSTLEANALLTRLLELKAAGIAIIYISHRLHEVMQIADRITVLRDGRSVVTGGRSDFTEDSMVAHMVGRQLTQRFPPPHGKPTEVVLKVEGLKVVSPTTQKDIAKNVAFSLKKGEILGVSGLMGSGRTEIALTLFGLLEGGLKNGTIEIEGKSALIRNPQDAIALGLALVSEDRKQSGLLLDRSVRDNLCLVHLDFFSSFGVLSKQHQDKVADDLIVRMGIKPPQADSIVKNLSGGNQQKVCIGKWLVRTPRILILDEPTRGVDVGAKFEIYSMMRDLSSQGVGIIMISSDLEEVLGMSDRVMVLAKGEVAAVLEGKNLSQELLMTYAVGGTTTTAAIH